MARIEGVTPSGAGDEYVEKVLAAQTKLWGAPLLNHLVYARRPSIFRGVRGMWAGLSKFNRALRIPSQALWRRAPL